MTDKGAIMRLKYVKGNGIIVNFGDEKAGAIEHTSVFSPVGEVPDKFIERLHKSHPGQFVEVPEEPQKAVCEKCQKEFKNEQGLLIHTKRKHKEES